MPVSENRLLRDFYSLMKNIASFSDGQAAVTKWDDESIETFEVTISPNGGPYKDGEFIFELNANEYPLCSTAVYCKTAIYHPNIDTIDSPEGEICFNLFDVDVWDEDCTLEDVVQGLLFLLYNPNLEDPLCCHVSTSLTPEEFEENVRISLAGGVIDNTFIYPPNEGYARKHPRAEAEKTTEGDMEKVPVATETDHGESIGADRALVIIDKENGREVDAGRNCIGVNIEDAGGDGEDAVEGREVDGVWKEQHVKEEQMVVEEQKVVVKEDGMVKGEEEEEGAALNNTESKDPGEGNVERKQNTVSCFFGIQQIVSDCEDEDEEPECLSHEEEEEYEEDCNGAITDNDDNDDKEQSCKMDVFSDFDDDEEEVNDEDLQLVIDKLHEFDAPNNQQVDQEGSGLTVSWSKLVYGSKGETFTDPEKALSVSEEDFVGCNHMNIPSVPSRTIQVPSVPSRTIQVSVVSRFFQALRTRNSRRWFL